MGSKSGGVEWTDREIELMRDRYADMTVLELAELLPGRSAGAIRQKLAELRINKQKAWRDWVDPDSLAKLDALMDKHGSRAAVGEVIGIPASVLKYWATIDHEGLKHALRPRRRVVEQSKKYKPKVKEVARVEEKESVCATCVWRVDLQRNPRKAFCGVCMRDWEQEQWQK